MNNNPLRELKGKVNPIKVLPFSLQQILAMFVTNLVPIGVVAAAAVPAMSETAVVMLVQNAMIAAGIATFLQATPVWRLGSGLPIFMGVSFTFMVPLVAVASKHGYGAVVGCVLAGGVFDGFCALDAFRLLEGVTAEDCRRFVAENLTADRFALSVIEPKKA